LHRNVKTIRVAIVGAVAVIAIAVVIRIVWPPAPPEGHDLLREVYTPHFAPVPERPPAGDAIALFKERLRSHEGAAFLRRWLPSQGGTLWLSLLVVVAVGVNVERLRHPRNLDLLALQALGLCFFDVLSFTRRLQDPYWLALLWWIFAAVFALSLLLAVRAVWRVTHPFGEDWRPPAARKTLAAIAIVVLALDVTAALVREPDDSSYFVNLGAQRLRERGRLPYGDPLLTGTPGAAYGPLLYVAQVPFQLLVDPLHLNESSTPRPPLGPDSQYRLPSPLAAQLCTIAFFLLGAWALHGAGTRFGSREIGWALVALYCGSTFVIGMGGEEYYIGGMTYISHIGPPAVTTAAFAALGRPALSGVLLVAATGCGFYPAFLFPAFAGHYWTRRRELRRFLVAATSAGVLLAAFVLLLSRPAGGRGLIGTILWDTFGHHSDPAGYGASPFGFWGQRAGFHGWLTHPLVGTSGLSAPVMLLFFTFAASCFLLARRRGARELALLSAAIVVGANLVKIHATGTYVTWFYPFLLLGLFLPARADALPSVTIVDSACPSGRDHQPS
jgi:hypothetical protein